MDSPLSSNSQGWESKAVQLLKHSWATELKCGTEGVSQIGGVPEGCWQCCCSMAGLGTGEGHRADGTWHTPADPGPACAHRKRERAGCQQCVSSMAKGRRTSMSLSRVSALEHVINSFYKALVIIYFFNPCMAMGMTVQTESRDGCWRQMRSWVVSGTALLCWIYP